ncbi:hypothetical protein AXG93_1502s1170 [Marchantia polymorpha subsp. ruderalis]|uniref:Uncharacterized protein n=1 Tax=Marchantia polymorpha subsp. ruderalis TaxID=1480154 RepID=A0A176WD26_MARPO|nr:hypothetical protein AXG93_1502s1170 [Marchantia polymorpha subsp. ruderalis]
MLDDSEATKPGKARDCHSRNPGYVSVQLELLESVLSGAERSSEAQRSAVEWSGVEWSATELRIAHV